MIGEDDVPRLRSQHSEYGPCPACGRESCIRRELHPDDERLTAAEKMAAPVRRRKPSGRPSTFVPGWWKRQHAADVRRWQERNR